MKMRYFKSPFTKDVFGYDETQQSYIDIALAAGWEEVTDSWPLKPDFKDTQALALVRVDIYHAEQVQSLVGNPTQTEKDTWSLKLEAANSIINKTTLTAPAQSFLTSAGLDSDADRLNWANSVIAKSVRYSTFVGIAEQLRSNARAAIKAATTEEELNAALEEHRKIAEDAVAELSVS